MDFARKQLLKYGWTDGKGLGKHENGISEPLKPKLKRSVAGVGYDAASDFTEHWWSQLYDKAAGNVEVEEANGKTKKIKTKDTDNFEITNSTWKLNRKKGKAENGEYSDNFVKKSILSGGSKVEKLAESDSEEEVKKDVFKMSDEELFAACEGRTAHKGARHGLKALGKLARIAQQEQALLLQPQYQEYSHAKKLKKTKEIVENANMNSDVEDQVIKKKKKKRKRCTSLNNSGNCEEIAGDDNVDMAESKIAVPEEDSRRQEGSVASNSHCLKMVEKKCTDENMVDLSEDVQNCNKESKKKKKRKTVDAMDVDDLSNEKSELDVKKRKKKKHKCVDE